MNTSSLNYLLAFLTIMISINSQINPSLALRCLSTKPATTAEFIRTSCKAATYPDLCYISLSTHANAIQTSPHSSAHTALSVALTTARTTKGVTSKISKDPGLQEREVGALRDCLEVLGNSVEELQKSLVEMSHVQINSKDFGLRMNNIQTWVSAALTNEDTCTEGFEEEAMDGRLKKSVRRRVEKISHLTSNALALINNPMLLANAALSVTLATARTTSAMVSQMSKDAGMRPREAGAMRDCLEVLRATVEELQQSITEMGDVKNSKNFGLQMNDIQTWVSAALTNEDTCTEGFGGKIMDGKLKTVMRGKIVNICHLTSNALALINSFASLHG
ncbi:hypothetical protein Cgig2_011954 [Carnegiea gigantea]|uniref:Pectinesterase inhibitor domain-containing protein n=1 Tax=Carnegiea gigantea TaxID=171969 RepID=A0A9Q1JIZ2_9CARY|nr:hypothetical protein Cgig2_011954 [Carnegiea gigantea]